MKNFKFLFPIAALLFAFSTKAQQVPADDPNIKNDSPHTETAFLNYDFKFQQSGFQKLEGGKINVQPGVRGDLRYNFEPDYDYTFIAISDSTTDGIGITGKPVALTANEFDTDSQYVFKEWGSKILVFPLPDAMVGDVEIHPMILGKTAPVESSYYILMRKKKSY